MGLSLNELLAADPSALRHSDWVELQRLARDEIAIDRDNLEKLKPLAARMREIDALVSREGRFHRETLRAAAIARFDTSPQLHEDDAVDLIIENLHTFAAALLTDGAVAAFQSGWDDEDSDTVRESFAAGIRAAIRAAGVEPVGVAISPDAKKTLDGLTVILSRHVGETGLSEGAVDVLTRKLAECATEKARADKAEAHADEQIADWKKAESTLAALETVIAETSHAAGISGTMTPAARVLEMGRAITQERNMSHDCQKDRNATLAKNRELNERATKAEGALVQMTKEADELRKAYASREAYDASIKATIAAESACKALRAEVVALRGLADNEDAHRAVRCHLVYQPAGYLITEAIRAALATVPPAKVADAVRPEPECTCAASGHFNLAEINACLRHGARAPKPEPAGLEPLGPPTVPGFPPMHYRGLVARINELSAIAKRGGL